MTMLFLNLACTALGTDPQSSDEVTLSGSLYQSVLGEGELQEGASIQVFDPGMQELSTAEESSPGNYAIQVPPGERFFLSVQAPGSLSSLWTGMAPTGRGLMYPLYAFDEQAILEFYADLEQEIGEIDTESGEKVQLWGTTLQFMTGEGKDIYLDQIEILEGQANNLVLGYRVEDGDIVRAQPGELVDWFFGINLDPGEVSVRITHPVDPTIQTETVYFPQAGETIAAFYTEGY
ncbi:MAG: hypothetical protein ACI9VR_003883 [Cognaticolwellia sp.]